MAVVFLFRIAVQLAPVVYRVCVTTGCDLQTYTNAMLRFSSRFFDADEDPDELSTDMTAAIGGPEGGTIVVTDFTGTFELRKLQWRLSRAPSGGTVEDQDVMTFHFIKAPGGTPGTWVDGTDLATIEARVTTFWTAIKPRFPSFVHSDQYRWYKDGPAFYELVDGTWKPLAAGNPAVRITEVDVAGTSAATNVNPPQTALTITEKTSSRRHWGRFYLPATGCSDTNDGAGRILSAEVDVFKNAAVTMYNGIRTDGFTPVVWSIQKEARPAAGGGTLPAVGGTAYEVTAIQMDNLFDVIRSRRYDIATYKPSTNLT